MGFLDAIHIKENMSETVARTTFHQFFVVNGLTRLAIVDKRNTFEGVVITFFKLLCIT